MEKAVVFDLDGTLLDTIPDIARALNSALSACGLPTHPVRAMEAFIGGGIRDAVRQAAPAGTSPETRERVLALYRQAYAAHCTEETACYPGVREMLSALAEQTVALGVLSNKTEETVRRIIAVYFPGIPFAGIYGRSEGRPLKPDPAAAAPVLAALRLPPERIAYVGDSGTDMDFASAVGMLPVAAPWGYRSREELEAHGAAALPETAGELGVYLLRWAAE